MAPRSFTSMATVSDAATTPSTRALVAALKDVNIDQTIKDAAAQQVVAAPAAAPEAKKEEKKPQEEKKSAEAAAAGLSSLFG